MESLERLNELYKDLIDFQESRLANVDRLWIELEDSLQDLRSLLDKKSKSDSSRKELENGKITIDDAQFEVNNDFKQIALEVADTLQLDELEAAKLVVQCQDESDGTPQAIVMLAAARFHERREVLLHDLRLVLKESVDNDSEEDGVDLRMQDFVANILDIKQGPPSNGSLFARKCLTALTEVEKSLMNLGDQMNKAKVVGQEQARVLLEFIEIQRTSLLRQHEALGAILCYLFHANYTTSEDFRKLIDLAKRRDRIDVVMLHYLPSIRAGMAQYGSADGSGNLRDARSLHKFLCPSTDIQRGQWSLHPLHAAITLMWVAEHSSWYREPGTASPLQGVDLAVEAEGRSKLASRALEEGALEFLLAICGGVRPEERLDAARQEILMLLLSHTSGLALEGEPTTEYFTLMLMECFEAFSEAFVTNMPDDIRRLKVEEDEQRMLKLMESQGGMSQSPQHEALDAHLHLEAMLVLMSFAYEHRPEAAERFWGDPDGNLYGFLQWASRRQTVPRVSAFCELLCALSRGEEPAASAHKFLLEESMTTARSRKTPSLNYGQIVAELQLYSVKVNERQSGSRPLPDFRGAGVPDLNELESPVMLSCYLRLIAHVCIETKSARSFFLDTKDFNFVHTVLLLSSGPVPSYLRATVFRALQALLPNKTSAVNNEIWTAIDAWATGALHSGATASKTSQPQQSPKATILQTFEAIAVSFDQANAFVGLIQALMVPPVDTAGLASLSFPDDLGSSYRMPGVEPYVDFVLGQLFAKRAPELPDEAQIRSVQYNCLDFAATCLDTFDEQLLVVAYHPSTSSTYSRHSSLVKDYTQRHPITRVMEWMFNADVVKCLLQALHQDIVALDGASSTSLVVSVLERAIDVVNLVLALQPTYLDLLKPAKKQLPSQSVPVSNSAIAAFEDVIAGHAEVLSDLAMYASTGHEALVLRSFNLIQTLAKSRRLATGRKGSNLSAFDLLKASGFVKAASLSLLPTMQIDVRELEHGPLTSEYRFKDAILTFLNASLSNSPSEKSVAHLFLGFTSIVGGFDLTLYNDDVATLLHAVIGLADNYPDGEDGVFLSWLVHVKAVAAEVLRRLWTCPPSSAATLSELRSARYLPSQFAKQQLVNSQTLWDGRTLTDPMFWLSDSAIAVNEFLRHRSFLYEYAVTEVRSVAHSRLPTLKVQTFSTLMGKSKFDDEVIEHPTVFELFDFANLDLGSELVCPEMNLLSDLDFASCKVDSDEATDALYNLEAVEQLLQLKVAQLEQENRFRPGVDDEQIGLEIETILGFTKAQNQRSTAMASYSRALRMWTKMVIVALESCPMNDTENIHFHLQAFQVVLPKLDSYLLNTPEQALDLATMVDTLSSSLHNVDHTSAAGRVGNSINDRLYQLFRIMLQGIHAPSASVELREVSYNTCSRFLNRINDAGSVASKARAHSLEAIKSAGPRVLTTLCDDADVGDGPCRLSALTALNSIVALGRLEKSIYIIDQMVYYNFLEVLIEPLKSIATDLQEAEAGDVQGIVQLLEVRLSLLLQISQTKVAARHLLDAGLLTAVRGSLLFQADPDMGIDIDNPTALQKYYCLLSSVLRLLVSTFVHRGPHNEQVQLSIRQFLEDHRSNLVGMFKKYSGIGRNNSGGVPITPSLELQDIIRSYTALLSMTNFIEAEQEQFQTRSKPLAFT